MAMKNLLSRLFAAALASAASVAAFADPPARVGRLVVHGGEVLMASGGADWRAVVRNYPVTSGDNVHVPIGSRAEVDFGSGTAWIAGGTTVYFERMDDQHFHARLADGQMIVRIMELDRNENAYVDLRSGQVRIVSPGLYRVEANASGTGRGGVDLLQVKAGTAELSGGGGFETLRSGDAVEFDGFRTGFLNIRGEDAFGAWADSRDRRYEGRRFAQVSPYMVGWRDLDDHGSWREHSQYGWVWYPRRVAADWAPYRFGHWTHVSPWGWTWVDDSPWGFAPFHYGRWVHLNGRWAWTPGPWERRPVYSPALVAWHGQIGNTNINVSIGSNNLVYWTPLSWGEAYYPSYTVSSTFWNVINRHHLHHSGYGHSGQVHTYSTTPPRDYRYRNWNVPGGATAVEAGVIAGARPVAPATRAMGPLPTTQQVEAMSIYDRVKPVYKGAAPVYTNNVQAEVPTRAAPVQEAGVIRAMPPAGSAPAPAIPSYSPPGRVAPPPPAQPQVVLPTRPAPAAPVMQAPPAPAQPVREMGVVTQQPPQPSQPSMSAPLPSRPAPQMAVPSQPVPVQQARSDDQRRISPTQNRGEAMPARPVPQIVEPAPQLPRAVAPQGVAPQAPVQDRPRNRQKDDDKPDREKPQR
jgi:hypothetical protein